MSIAFGQDMRFAVARPWIAGNCAALAAFSGVKPWIVRVAAIALLLWHPAAILLLYVVAAVLMRRGLPMPARRFGWFKRRSFSFNHFFGNRPSGEPEQPMSHLSEIGRRLAMLDRRLEHLESQTIQADDALKARFRNL